MPDRFPLTRALADFAADTRDVPAAASDLARTGIVDALGLVVRARQEPVVQAIRALGGAPAGPCSLLLTGERTDAVHAATVNATAAHAFALDDVAWGCHPSAMLLPALLAAGEEIDASGADLLRAWVVGYEVLAELAAREPGSLHGTGWHPSGLLGPVAVAAAVANLRRFDAATAAGALATAASFSGGLSANFGTPVKALHAGRAAGAGVLACALAQRGQCGAPDALERPGGFLETISPSRQVDLHSPMQARPGAPRLLEAGLGLKRYPLCYSLHRIADAAIALAGTHAIDPDAVERIDVAIGTRQLQMAPHRVPQSGMQARYSAPFAVAAGLVARAAGFAQLEPAFYGSPQVHRLIACTTFEERHAPGADDPVFAPSDRVRVVLRDGRCLDSGEVAHPRGHARDPLTQAERLLKFIDCLAGSDVADPARLFGQLEGLAAVASVRSLAQWVAR